MMELVNAISNTLYGLYPDRDIYIEDIEQNFVPGTFFIDVSLESTDNGMVSFREYRTYTYDVMYYPRSETEPRAAMLEMGENLRLALKLMEYNGKYIKGSDISVRIVDEVLHVLVSYNVVVDNATIETPVMDKVDIKVDVKGPNAEEETIQDHDGMLITIKHRSD